MIQSIIDIAADYGVDLQISGNIYKACCPFHGEKTASCFFYPDTNSFYCFGCSAGGDVIEFVKLSKGISYAEAIKVLGIEDDRFSTKSLRSKLTATSLAETSDIFNKYYLLGNKLLFNKKMSISEEATLLDKYYDSYDLDQIKALINQLTT